MKEVVMASVEDVSPYSHRSFWPLRFYRKAFWELTELATKENAHSLINNFVRDTFSLPNLHRKHEWKKKTTVVSTILLPILWPHLDCKGCWLSTISVIRNKKLCSICHVFVTFRRLMDRFFKAENHVLVFYSYLPNPEHTPYEGLCFIPGPIRTIVVTNMTVSHIASSAAVMQSGSKNRLQWR